VFFLLLGGAKMEKILQCPRIYEGNKEVGYGGNQDWFLDTWAQKAGCGSVSANDIYMYYTSDKTTYQKQEYLQSMNAMFDIMIPKNRGFPYAYLYARRLQRCLQKQNIEIKYQILRNTDSKTTIALVKQSIDDNNPLGLLILNHLRWCLRDDIWHWVTIFGYRETRRGLMIIFSDCGKKKEIPARILFENKRNNYFKLVMFDTQ
jgi:hypothetical protein